MAILINSYSGIFGGQTYVPNAVDFDVAAVRRNAALTGVVDGRKGIVSFWVKPVLGGAQTIFYLLGGYFRVGINASTLKVNVAARNTSGTIILNLITTTDLTASVWNHVGASFDLTTLGAELTHLYTNGTSNKTVTTATGGQDIDYTRTDAAIGLQINPYQNDLDGGLAELYINTAEYLDLSVAANLEKFRSAGGAPVYLGSNGSTPTSTAPALYMKNPSATYGVNSGTAGDFTLATGALTDIASPP